MTHPTQADGRRFARMNLKAASTPVQPFDQSMVAATGFTRTPGFMRAEPVRAFNWPAEQPPRSQFLNRFASTEKLTEAAHDDPPGADAG